MFYNIKDHRQALEDFVFGTDTLQDLMRRTQWESTWGWPISNYAKLLNYAKAEGIRIVGLNAPERVSNFVKHNGIQGLLGKPKIPEMDLSNRNHLARFMAGPLAEDHRIAGTVRANQSAVLADLPLDLKRIYEEQILREEWMAAAVAGHA